PDRGGGRGGGEGRPLAVEDDRVAGARGPASQADHRGGMNDLYDTDTVLWAERQAALLRRMAAGERVNDQVDWENVVEEIADVARRDRDRIFGQLVTICLHLLKWQFQSDQRSNSWRSSVVGARDRIAKLIKD